MKRAVLIIGATVLVSVTGCTFQAQECCDCMATKETVLGGDCVNDSFDRCVDIIGRDYSPHFASMHIPVMALWGDRDKLTSVGSVLKRLDGLPRLRTVMLRRTGHMPMIERPEETLFHLRRFLESPP